MPGIVVTAHVSDVIIGSASQTQRVMIVICALLSYVGTSLCHVQPLSVEYSNEEPGGQVAEPVPPQPIVGAEISPPPKSKLPPPISTHMLSVFIKACGGNTSVKSGQPTKTSESSESWT